jgi:hypothetical protein
VGQRRRFRTWNPPPDRKRNEAGAVRSLSEDELFTGWWTEGSTPFRRSRTGTVKRIVYLSQTGDRTFMEWWCEQIKEHGFDCVLVEREKGDFELAGSLASAWIFHVRIVEPRKEKLPLHKRKVHNEAMRVLPRQIGRGFGEKIRSQFK